MDCKYVQDINGNVVVHPKTGDPLQNCSKTDFAVAMETIERVSKQILPSVNEPGKVDISNNTTSTSSDCKTCK
jgi:hypothetical protein